MEAKPVKGFGIKRYEKNKDEIFKIGVRNIERNILGI